MGFLNLFLRPPVQDVKRCHDQGQQKNNALKALPWGQFHIIAPRNSL
jgi:hypothetical protein